MRYRKLLLLAGLMICSLCTVTHAVDLHGQIREAEANPTDLSHRNRCCGGNVYATQSLEKTRSSTIPATERVGAGMKTNQYKQKLN